MTLSTKESLTDIAFNCLSQHTEEVPFSSLWQEVANAAGIPEEKKAKKKAQFYSALMLDNRFTARKGNNWDLAKRRKFDEIHANKALLDEYEDDTDEEEEEENLEEAASEEEF